MIEKNDSNEELLHVVRHSTSHVMAEAVLQMFPDAKIAIGPSIKDGFYYDFDLPRPLTPDDLKEIEKRMKDIIKGKLPFVRRELSRAEALELFADQPYKLELIQDLPEGEAISIYTSGAFTDLCRGPHVENTSQLKWNAFKLLSIAGAYWRGDENRPMLQRIYGTAWESKADLRAYLDKLKEIEARDHRRLAKQLDLYSLHEEAGAGLVYWHPKGGRIRTLAEDFWRQEHFANGYEILYTPHIGKAWLWQTSGHLDFYNESMYSPMDIDGVDYYLKPMNCPFHILVYKTNTRSYRDLPLRWAEMGTVYRYERSGVLHGLLRVRGFTQDDAHHFCTPEQIEDEILFTLRFSLHLWKAFGFEDVHAYLATRPEKSVGEPARWPKIDLKIRDALDREWQMTTIQFDFNLPERFDMVYVGEDGKEHRPYMVHRALLGSMERFFGVLIEHYGGAFPVWLSPVQVVMIPIADRHVEYAQGVVAQLKAAGLRAEVDDSGDRMNAKIRKAQLQKVPYMLVVGDREMEAGRVAVRLRTEEDLGAMDVSDLIARVRGVVEAKRGL